MTNNSEYKLNIQTSVAEVYEQYTRYSYTEEYALAEFIDNSTASFYNNEKKLFEEHVDKLLIIINYDEIENKLIIHDEAFGMDKEEFDDALIAGRKPKQTWRNEFGYGLKTAATWFGRHWSVTSSKLGSSKKYHGYIDLDELKEKNTNEIPIFVSEERPDAHYTHIVISKLNRHLSGKKIKNKIIEVLNSMYRRDLVTGKIEIMYNGTTLEFQEYEPLTYKDRIYKKEISFSFIAFEREYRVTGFVGILNKGSFKKGGFALLRANRVIVSQYRPSEIFVQVQNAISKNLYGEIYMDDFKVNQAKDGIAWLSPEVEEKFIECLKEAVRDYLPVAKLTVGERVEKEEEYQRLKNQSNEENILHTPENSLSIYVKENEEKPISKESVNVQLTQVQSTNLYLDQDKVNKNKESENPLCIQNEYLIELDNKNYVIKWEQIENSYFLYRYNKDENMLIINLNHSFPKQCNTFSRKDVSKLLLSFILSEQKAEKMSNEIGYVNASMIRNNINKLLY